jgi:hypothetical protein
MLQRGDARAEFTAKFSGLTFELAAHFLRKFVDAAHSVYGFALKIGKLQCHFARKEKRGDRTLKFVLKGLLYCLPDQLDFFLMAMQGCSKLACHSIRVVDGKIHVNRNGLSNVLENHVAFDRLGFEKSLIDQNSHVFPGTELGQRLGRGGYNVGFLGCDSLNGLRATRGFGRRRND